MTNEATSFWKFIGNYQIEIPIIQRDYAQGRLGKEHLRNNFLVNLKLALDYQLPEPALKLDFVYGSEDEGKLSPLDGQQRLTTKAEKFHIRDANIFKGVLQKPMHTPKF